MILSSKFIPGNEKTISNLINHLYRRGAEVHYEKVSEIHVSGHASQEELKTMLQLTRPRYFVPIHGEYRHLVRHRRLAQDVGIPAENCFLLEDGDVLELTANSAQKTKPIQVGKVFVDGKGVGDVGDIVIRDRRHLSEDGMVLVGDGDPSAVRRSWSPGRILSRAASCAPRKAKKFWRAPKK